MDLILVESSLMNIKCDIVGVYGAYARYEPCVLQSTCNSVSRALKSVTTFDGYFRICGGQST